MPSTKKQNKNLDLAIKIKNKIFICEAKHLNTSGGGQDKQLSELAEDKTTEIASKGAFFIHPFDNDETIPYGIIYWTQWLMHLLKTTVEQTSVVSMAGAF
jgi:hypothetical protein